jgi:hypothetical protein
MITMVFAEKERRLLFGAEMIILLCFPAIVLSFVSSSLTLPNYGQISIQGREYPTSSFTYRIFQNSTSTYRINSTGFVDDNYRDPGDVFNNALESCASAGGGSIYVLPDTYQTATPLGRNGIWSNWTNIYVCFGGETTFNYTSGSGASLFNLNAVGACVVNCTFTSNGTAYFNGNGYVNGPYFSELFNCTFQNIVFEHMYSQGIYLRRSRYCTFQNITVYSYDEAEGGQSAFACNGVQYSTFQNITIDGNYQSYTRVGFYMSDWEDTSAWNGTYFNTVQGLWIKNNKGDGIYLNSGASGYHVYNNTFTNCTIENNWRSAQSAIKLRPAQNNTFTNIIIRNFTDPVTTGTSIPPDEAYGNCTGNYVQATIYDSKVTSLILTADGDDQSVDHNFFDLNVYNSEGTYFASGVNSPIHDNTVYIYFTNCTGGLYFEGGYIQNNKFYCSFSNSATATQADIWFYNDPNFDSNIIGNKIYVSTHGNNTFLRFTNGTYQNYVYYPWNG